MCETNEIWKSIDGWGGRYEISNYGNVRSLGVQMKPNTHYKNGYKSILFKMNGIQKRETIHSLVARYFLPNPLNHKEVNHKDGNKNNNAVENLEWCTRQWNCVHAIKIGLRPINGAQKAIVAINDVAIQEFKSVSEACGILRISRRTIRRVMDTDKAFIGYNFYSL